MSGTFKLVGESVPAGVAPPGEVVKGGVAAGTEAPAHRRRLRLPTSLLATVLGIGLTAWLLPAFTRQWDDRQKERELKAAVVENMGSATALAIVGGEAIWSKRPVSASERKQLADRWARSQLQIGARLRAYFPAAVVASWNVYAWAVDRFIDAHRVSAAAAFSDAVSGVPLPRRVAERLRHLFLTANLVFWPKPRFEGDSPLEEVEVASLQHRLAVGPAKAGAEPSLSWRPLEKLILLLERAVADEVLRAHAAGYSSTASDLVDDLLP